MKITFVEDVNDANRIEELAKNKSQFIIIPLFNELPHPLLTDPVVVFLKLIHQDELFIVGFSHSEVVKHAVDFNCFRESYVYNKKYFFIDDTTDIDSIYYVNNLKYSFPLKNKNSFEIRPIYKLVGDLTDIISEFENICINFIPTKASEFLNSITLPSLTQVESYGIKINDTFESKNIVYNGLVYSQYNCWTVTGRPANRYGGVNFAALNKSDGSRECYVSRFDDGMLYMLDYDSYHLRLIANLINYKLPDGNIHTYFAKQYFNTENITDDMYEQSKVLSFTMLYGGVIEEHEHIDFFKKVRGFINILWEKHQVLGYTQSVISGKLIYADSKTKLFNYLIQGYETELNMLVLHKLLRETSGFASIPVLYTYDSLLFDVEPGETEEYLSIIKQIMEMNGKFPVKISCGKNYGNMHKV